MNGGKRECSRELVEHAESIGRDQDYGVRSEGLREIEVRSAVPKGGEEPARCFDDRHRGLVAPHPTFDGTEIDACLGLPRGKVRGDWVWKRVKRSKRRGAVRRL
jgi:hypothetical protein